MDEDLLGGAASTRLPVPAKFDQLRNAAKLGADVASQFRRKHGTTAIAGFGAVQRQFAGGSAVNPIAEDDGPSNHTSGGSPDEVAGRQRAATLEAIRTFVHPAPKCVVLDDGHFIIVWNARNAISQAVSFERQAATRLIDLVSRRKGLVMAELSDAETKILDRLLDMGAVHRGEECSERPEQESIRPETVLRINCAVGGDIERQAEAIAMLVQRTLEMDAVSPRLELAWGVGENAFDATEPLRLARTLLKNKVVPGAHRINIEIESTLKCVPGNLDQLLDCPDGVPATLVVQEPSGSQVLHTENALRHLAGRGHPCPVQLFNDGDVSLLERANRWLVINEESGIRLRYSRPARTFDNVERERRLGAQLSVARELSAQLGRRPALGRSEPWREIITRAMFVRSAPRTIGMAIRADGLLVGTVVDPTLDWAIRPSPVEDLSRVDSDYGSSGLPDCENCGLAPGCSRYRSQSFQEYLRENDAEASRDVAQYECGIRMIVLSSLLSSLASRQQ